MSTSKPGNSYRDLEKGVVDIAMPPVGFVVGGENAPEPENQDVEKEYQPLESTHEESSQVEEDDQSDEVDEIEEVEEIVQPVKKTKEDNLRIMREKAERAERERDLMMTRMIEMEAREKKYQPKPEPIKEEVEEELKFDFSEDDLVDGKTAKKMLQKIERLEKKLNNQSHQSKEMATESRIKSDFPDFDKVVSVDNVQRLNEEYPEIAITLRDTPDLYNKAAAAYKIMKKFGIHKELYGTDKAKAIENAKKPRPLASVSPQQGDTPLSKANAFANGMTKELQEQLRKEMAEARKGY